MNITSPYSGVQTNIPHTWAFLPDFARAAVMLAEKRSAVLMFEDIPFEGHTLSAAIAWKLTEMQLSNVVVAQ